MSNRVHKITIDGFKSIKKLDIELKNVNILIGPNGAGKSNFIQFFDMLDHLIHFSLQRFFYKRGGADQFLYHGPKITQTINVKLEFKELVYQFGMEITDNSTFMITDETAVHRSKAVTNPNIQNISAGVLESKFNINNDQNLDTQFIDILHHSRWRYYHFLDTSNNAAMKRNGNINDNESLKPDAGNLAAFLFAMQNKNPEHYNKILKTIQLAAPFIDQFKLRPDPNNEDQIRFEWLQKDSDFPFMARHLSDGTLRFICLVTALLQPYPPSTLLLDEPELGLHPYALSLLADLIKTTSQRTQVIVSTQSTYLIDHFTPEDIIVVDRDQEGASEFKRLNAQELEQWLEDYSLGELWEKNVIGGRP